MITEEQHRASLTCFVLNSSIVERLLRDLAIIPRQVVKEGPGLTPEAKSPADTPTLTLSILATQPASCAGIGGQRHRLPQRRAKGKLNFATGWPREPDLLRDTSHSQGHTPAHREPERRSFPLSGPLPSPWTPHTQPPACRHSPLSGPHPTSPRARKVPTSHSRGHTPPHREPELADPSHSHAHPRTAEIPNVPILPHAPRVEDDVSLS